MVMPRALLVLCAAVVLLSDFPGVSVSARLMSPLRQLGEEVVKVHIKAHQKEEASQPKHHDATPSKKHAHKHHAKEGEEKTTESGETVRSYDHGTVRIESKGAMAGKKLTKSHQKKAPAKKEQTDETVVEYSHGTVKISGTETTDGETTDKTKKDVTPDEKEVTSTANKVNELVTKLSSTDSTEHKSFIEAYDPVVVICGIIGGLAAIVGVVGLVMGQPQSNDDNLDSVLSASDLDVDVEANATSSGVQNPTDEDLLGDSNSKPVDDEEEEEGTFANGTAHVSV
ncbi:hypothetical protein GN244_ATG05574 [Phytophthora infestans]|uniref:Uncharacterized protein n=1 Tax=Phytophthora infestans TaxID=4787 RepID=A0A833T4G2_PHYIN|nr:hypothetical protein GN244_ATG05574 [Phytophthora infestans]